MKLTGKIFIEGKIKAVTGLHIGGSKTALDIGGIDLNVIKTSEGIPYIPGSSLKGKLRSLLAREYGSESVNSDNDTIKEIFGESPNKESEGKITRLIVRDSFIGEDIKKNMESKNGEFSELELEYTEGKWENTIDRKSGTAGNPRQIERVPAGAEFTFELVYNVYDNKKDDHIKEIIKAMRLLEDDYIGGSGSRGYGKVKFTDVKFLEKTIDIYSKDNKRVPAKFENQEDIKYESNNS